MISAIIMMGGLGIIVGIGLAIASKVFYVYVDPLILTIDDALPGANCGGCGFPGCTANAEAIVKGTSAANSCVAGGQELTEAIASLLGVTVEAKEPDIALPGCKYGSNEAQMQFVYKGINTCRAASFFSGGMKVCNTGCLGLGSCVNACMFGALSMGKDGLPVVNKDLCTGCGNCEKVCPKKIINLSSVTRRILQEYTTNNCVTPCQRSCPAGINISEYIKQINLNNYKKAIEVIKERNPFPAVIGRICPRFCELDCRRNLIDEPVAINFLKRFVSDYEQKNNKHILPYKAPETGHKVAIIGGGVSGLSTAYFLARLGHSPAVFEEEKALGGLLRKAIDKSRLPSEVLDWDIEGISEMGVEINVENKFGDDLLLKTLFEKNFEFIFSATGGWDSKITKDVKLSPVLGIYLLLDLIRFSNNDNLIFGSDVVINDGGKLALNAAQICKAKGAKNVTILLKDNIDSSSFYQEDIENLTNQNIKIIYNSNINRIIGENNEISEVEIIDNQTLETDIISAQNLVFSSGRFPELIFTKITSNKEKQEDKVENKNGKWEAIEPYKNPDYSEQIGVLTQDESISDYNAAIKAIDTGRRAAASIHELINDNKFDLPNNVINQNTIMQRVDHLEDISKNQRQLMPISSQFDIDFTSCEYEKGFDEEIAKKEAKRCLECGIICYKQS